MDRNEEKMIWIACGALIAAGKFAVIRFSGWLTDKVASEKEVELREWMTGKNLAGSTTSETAGYDPPWLPGLLRRNEILIRVNG